MEFLSELSRQISPGLVETPFLQHHFGVENASKMFQHLKILEANDVADAVVYQLSSPSHVQVQDIILRSVEQAT